MEDEKKIGVYTNKSSTRVSIFISEEEFSLPKEVNELAKTDPRFLKKEIKNKNFMLSFVTRRLWKSYIDKRKKEEAEKKCPDQ